MASGINSLKVGKPEASEFLGISQYVLDKMIDNKEIEAEPVKDGGNRTHFRFSLHALRVAKKFLAEKAKQAKIEAAELKKAEPTNSHPTSEKTAISQLQGMVQSLRIYQTGQNESLQAGLASQQLAMNLVLDRLTTQEDLLKSILDKLTNEGK